jgi:hypothetical protein
LVIAILGSSLYFLWAQSDNRQERMELTAQYNNAVSSKTELEDSYNATLFHLDSLSVSNSWIKQELIKGNFEINDLQNQIRQILRRKQISESARKKAGELIAELNTKINSLDEELTRLKMENQLLATQKAEFTLERDTYKAQKDTLELVTKELADKVNIASTLNAYDIKIVPSNKRSRGKKSSTLLIAFDVYNRIAEPGPTDIYIVVVDADGKPLVKEPTDQGTFVSREEGEKPFTAKIPVEIEAGKQKRVEFEWPANKNTKKRNYTFAIYHNGFKIGETVRST